MTLTQINMDSRIRRTGQFEKIPKMFFKNTDCPRKLTHGLRSFSQVPRVMRVPGPQPAFDVMTWDALVFKGNSTEGWICKCNL